jgi:hypothetical protein
LLMGVVGAALGAGGELAHVARWPIQDTRVERAGRISATAYPDATDVGCQDEAATRASQPR